LDGIRSSEKHLYFMLLTIGYLVRDCMSDIDVFLAMIENPTRRRILEALVREPHYPLQLSRELQMSQQAIMKHLKVLEENALVRSFPEESDQGGPTRRIYVPITRFSIVVDVGPGLFNAEIVSKESIKAEIGGEPYDQPEVGVSTAEEYSRTRDAISLIDRELGQIQKRRAELIGEKERLLEEARDFVESRVGEYQARRVIFEAMKRSTLTPEEIARGLGLRDEVVRRILDHIGNGGGV